MLIWILSIAACVTIFFIGLAIYNIAIYTSSLSQDFLIDVKSLKGMGQSEDDQKRAWAQITKKICYAHKHGETYAIINASIYKHIPMETFGVFLKQKGYTLEGNWEQYYNKGLVIEIRWGNRYDSKSYEHF